MNWRSLFERSTRNVPPNPALAWFLSDLVPDLAWNDFDLGKARSEALDAVRAGLHRHGGRDAWLRFLDESRRELPHMLDGSFVELFARAKDQTASASRIWISHQVTLQVYAAGRVLAPPIEVAVYARLDRVSHRQSSDHALFDIELSLRHSNACVLRTCGRYYLPLVDPSGDVSFPSSDACP